MPPRHITEATNPHAADAAIDGSSDRRGWLGGRLGSLVSGGESRGSGSTVDLDMNVAESYGIKWDAEKCGRDASQNFFDANGGTLDGVHSYGEELPGVARPEGASPHYGVTIEASADYDFRDLTVIGATTKSTGEHTAGGFGEVPSSWRFLFCGITTRSESFTVHVIGSWNSI